MKKLFLLLFLGVLPIVASADMSGTIGDNVSWTYVESTKTLTISGTGSLYVGIYPEQIPWASFRDEIERIIIEYGITGIGGSSFWRCTGLVSVTIPNSVTSIGYDSFYNCI